MICCGVLLTYNSCLCRFIGQFYTLLWTFLINFAWTILDWTFARTEIKWLWNPALIWIGTLFYDLKACTFFTQLKRKVEVILKVSLLNNVQNLKTQNMWRKTLYKKLISQYKTDNNTPLDNRKYRGCIKHQITIPIITGDTVDKNPWT